jgi:hypothetical protein
MMADEKKGLVEQMDALVRDHLPEKVGHELRKELERLHTVEQENERLKMYLEKANKEISLLADFKRTAGEVEEMKADVEKSADELQKLRVMLERRTAVLDAVTSERNLRVSDMKELVAAVFSNNQFKYTRIGSQDVFVPPHTDYYGTCQSAQTISASHEETVTGEGDVPPIGPVPAPVTSPVPSPRSDT